MLDLMELRGFSLTRDRGGRQFILVTPTGVGYAVQMFPNHSEVQCVFAAFETLNQMYP